MDLKDKLKTKVQSAPKAEPRSNITVRPGKQPFTYYTNDGMNEYLTSVDGDQKSCNCDFYRQHKTDCTHISAVEAVMKALA
jgi:hypothetical protein